MKKVFHILLMQASLFVLQIGGAFAEASRDTMEAVTDYIGAVTENVEVAIDHAGDAVEHSSPVGLPQLDPTWFPSQLFWLVVMFSILYVIFSKKILPDMSRTIEKRQSHIQDDLDTAHRLKQEAETAHKAYEELLSHAHQEALGLIHKNDEEMKEKYQSFLDDFQVRSAKKIQKTEESINKAKTTAIDDMHDLAAEIASDVAEKIVGIKTDIKKAKSVVKSIEKKAA